MPQIKDNRADRHKKNREVEDLPISLYLADMLSPLTCYCC